MNITLGDVANVSIAAEPPIGGATIEGKPGVMMMIYGSTEPTLLRLQKTLKLP